MLTTFPISGEQKINVSFEESEREYDRSLTHWADEATADRRLYTEQPIGASAAYDSRAILPQPDPYQKNWLTDFVYIYYN